MAYFTKLNTIILILSYSVLILNLSCSDQIVEPDEQNVQILYKYYYKDELNTFDKYLIKDLVLDGLIKVDFWLTTAEQESIKNKVYELNFFSMPDSMMNTAPVEISPNFTQYLRIKIDDDDHEVTWNIILPEYQIEDHIKIIELGKFIRDIIESKPEYLKLPPKRGGYD